MNPEKQRIKIAEACGFNNPRLIEVANVEKVGDRVTVGMTSDMGWLPDYLNDLNAMHEAEKKFNSCQQWGAYELELSKIVEDADQSWWFTHATAAQRAEAFLRTLGLWEEET